MCAGDGALLEERLVRIDLSLYLCHFLWHYKAIRTDVLPWVRGSLPTATGVLKAP